MTKLCFMKNSLHSSYFSQFTEYHENFSVNQGLATNGYRQNPGPTSYILILTLPLAACL